MNSIKLILSLAILIGVLSCNKISEKVEKKVNEKIDRTIDENLNKIDSSLNQANIDSLKRMMKSIDSTLQFEIIESDKK
jgi:sensor domain CHASE-containing protein